MSNAIDTAGKLTEGISAGDGSTYRSVARGFAVGFAIDAQAVTFTPNWGTTPAIRFGAGGITFDGSSTLSGSYGQVYQAANLSKSGFVPSLDLRETVSSPSNVTATGTSDPGSPAGVDLSINKPGPVEAVDDTYTFQFDVTVQNITVGGGLAGQVKVGLYTNDGSGWVQRKQLTFPGSPSSGQTFYTDETHAVVVGGLGTNDDFGISIDDDFLGGSSITFDNVKWQTATSPARVTATPTGSEPVQFFVLGGA